MSAPLRVTFAFASRGIGGAERSMLRLMAQAHPHRLRCRVIVCLPGQRGVPPGGRRAGVPYHGCSPARPAGGLAACCDATGPTSLYVFGRFRTLLWAARRAGAGVRCIVAAERSAANRWSDRLARRLDRGW